MALGLRLLVGLALVAALAGCAPAQRVSPEVQQARIEASRGNVPVAIRMLETPAEQGDTAAQFELGRIYGAYAKDYPQAMKWYLLAAQKLDDVYGAAAAYNIGGMYATGQSVKQDYAECARWGQMSAALSYTPPHHYISPIYTH